MARGGSGGSQLAQLKGSLKAAGVSDRRQQSASSKKRKRGNQASERDEAAARRAALAKIGSENPFEQKVTKLKHDVLGRKVKGAVGHPALAKEGGLAQRRATLLPEWQNRNRSGTFIDRRFGESDETMTPEERMLERFTREKQRQQQPKGKKASLFNLNDDEGQEEELTHFGRSLSAMGPLPEPSMVGDEADEDGAGINALSTAQDHFGGFEAGPSDGPKTKAEVMREVMAKSKMHKMERQQMRDADDELRAQLDDELGDIRGLLMGSRPTEPDAADGGRALAPKNVNGDYDAYVRELAFERRAKPQDKLKTEAELAEEEADQLRKAELARVRRMRGEAVDEDDTDGKNRRRGAPQGDDLEDDFDIEGQTAAEVYGLGSGLGEEQDDDDVASGDEESDDDEDAASSNDGEQDAGLEEDGYGSALDEESDEDDDSDAGGGLTTPSQAAVPKPKEKKQSNKAAAPSVPFTFSCPITHEDFLTILARDSLQPAQVPLVIKRIRALHHPSLAEDNKFKLQAFTGVLLDHALYSASQAMHAEDEEQRTVYLGLVNYLLKPIFELSTAYPKASAEHFCEKLALMERNLNKGLSKGAVRATSRTWPGATELTLLRLAGLVWPTSDLSHVVTTPLILLEAHYLAHCRVRSYSDLASGLFIVSLVLQQQSGQDEAQRLVPEALNFVHNALMLLLPLKQHKLKEAARKVCQRYAVPAPDFNEEHAKHLALSGGSGYPAETPQLFDILASKASASQAQGEGDVEPAAEAHDAQMSVNLFNLTLGLIEQLADLYRGTSAFMELFEPFLKLLQIAEPTEHWALQLPAVAKCRTALGEHLETARQARRPLRLHAHRAIPLASFVPKFDEGGRRSRVGGAFDPDSARAETAKLQALYKKEKKGAVRELRRDAQFLAQHRAEERRKEDESYKRKIGKITAALGEERGEEKRLQREKERLKRKGKAGR
ncbi:unnamed protein product [Parajaminaea phylloscopi]